MLVDWLARIALTNIYKVLYVQMLVGTSAVRHLFLAGCEINVGTAPRKHL